MRIAVAFCLLLAACSSGGTTPLERLRPIAEEYFFGREEPEEIQVTRAQLDQIPFATIAVSSEISPRAYVIPLADNGGYLSYVDESQRTLVLFGGLITGTYGLGLNLAGVKHAVDDPVANPTPVDSWPTAIDRSYQFPRRDQNGYSITVRCQFQQVASETIEIVELNFDLIRVQETCRNNVRTFTNTYWAEAATGRIWKSVQWIGPQQNQLTIEVIRPYQRQS